MKRAILLLVLAGPFALVGACTQFPALDRTITPELEAADYPALVPLGPVIAAARDTDTDPARTTAAIDARVAALRARAARLRGAVLSGPERQRLAEGLQ